MYKSKFPVFRFLSENNNNPAGNYQFVGCETRTVFQQNIVKVKQLHDEKGTTIIFLLELYS